MLNKSIYLILFCIIFVIALIAYLRINCQTRLKNKAVLFDILFCLALSLGICFMFGTCSLISSKNPQADSAVFLYIGKAMHNGKVLYRDLFDHKGPLLYFIQYFGLFFGDKIGVWVLELCNIFITSWFALKTARLITRIPFTEYIATAFSLGICGVLLYGGGNLVEVWSLIWISSSLYVVIKHIKTQSYKPWDVILLGMGLASTCLLRVNMASLWIFAIPFILFAFIKKKRWKDILQSILFCIIGMIIVCLPASVYLLTTDSFIEFWRYYILFNLEYSSGQGLLINILTSLRDLTPYILIGVALFAATILYGIKDKLYRMNLYITLVSLFFLSIGGRAYPHYAIVLLPLFVIPSTILFDNLWKMLADKKKNVIKVDKTIALLICFFLLPITVFSTQKIIVNDDGKLSSMEKYIINNSEDNSNVLVMSNRCSAYLNTNRYSDNKFFYQEPPLNISHELLMDFRNQQKVDNADIIVIEKTQYDYLHSDYADSNNLAFFLDELDDNNKYIKEEYPVFYAYKLRKTEVNS